MARPAKLKPMEILNISETARRIVNDHDYQKAFFERLVHGALPPQLEVMIWHYAFGQPPKEVRIVDPNAKTLQELIADKRAELEAKRNAAAINGDHGDH